MAAGNENEGLAPKFEKVSMDEREDAEEKQQEKHDSSVEDGKAASIEPIAVEGRLDQKESPAEHECGKGEKGTLVSDRSQAEDEEAQLSIPETVAINKSIPTKLVSEGHTTQESTSQVAISSEASAEMLSDPRGTIEESTPAEDYSTEDNESAKDTPPASDDELSTEDGKAELVTKFNALPMAVELPHMLNRQQSMAANHWYFTIRPAPPNGDLLFITNTANETSSVTGSRQLLSLETAKARAAVAAPLLLKVFVTGAFAGFGKKKLPDSGLHAPRSWSTSDDNFALAMEEELEQLGVRKELCTVQAASDEDEEVAEALWDEGIAFMEVLRQSEKLNISGCFGCKRPSSFFASGLSKCSRCGIAEYCSSQCQKGDWKHKHKKVCGKDPAFVEPFDYYNFMAHVDENAVTLASSMNLKLPGCGGDSNLGFPIRRLVVTGKDTYHNKYLLFGPLWEDSLSDTLTTARIEFLLKAPRGSSSYRLNAPLDEGAPYPTPRPRSEAEIAKLREIREMQVNLWKYLQNQDPPKRKPREHDMEAFIQAYKIDLVQGLQTYLLAANTLDQGLKSEEG